MKKFVLLCGLLGASFALLSQTNVNMGSTASVTGCSFYIYDDGGPTGNYGATRNDVLTIYPTGGSGLIQIFFYEMDIDEGDTLFFFNGPSVNYEATQPQPFPLIFTGALGTNWVNNSNQVYTNGNEGFSATIHNTTGAITLLFKSNGSVQSSGFKLKVICGEVCQRIILKLDEERSYPQPVFESDSVAASTTDACNPIAFEARTESWNYFNICPDVRPSFAVDCQFLDNDFNYNQRIDSCYFKWRIGNDTAGGWGMTTFTPSNLLESRGYNLSVTVKDHKGCIALGSTGARIRVANPAIIEEVKPLHSICMGDTLPISIGTRQSSSIQVAPWTYTISSTLGRDELTYIPDGPSCGSQRCYNSHVQFNVFSDDALIESASDIIGVCVKIEHSYSGDIDIYLTCQTPSNVTKSTQLFLHNSDVGSVSFGKAYSDYGNCNPNAPQGIGWDYCWTENNCIDHYPHNLTYSTGSVLNRTYPHRVPNPAIYACSNCTQCTHSWDSSWRYSDPPKNYYTPQQSFANLVGCKMNSTWAIQVCDQLGRDDGFVFNWDITLSKRLLVQDWDYTISAEDIMVNGDGIQYISPSRAAIIPTSPGVLNYDIIIVDNLGCEYHNNVALTVQPLPEPDLGEDFSICTGEVIPVTASNVIDGTTFYWNNGRTTQTINIVSEDTYIVEATSTYTDPNYNTTYKCKGYDTLVVTVNPTPFVAFSIEGNDKCQPAPMKLKNETTFAIMPGIPIEDVGATYQWYIWDNDWNLFLSSTLVEPEFIIETAGSYHVMLLVYTPDGCNDSLIKYNYIHVYPQPVVEFLAIPESQMLSDGGIVYFHNYTDSAQLADPNCTWYWDFGDGTIDSSSSSPSHAYETWGDYDILFHVHNTYGCSDQLTHRITIEENITFPNIITPNGDGLNDVFVVGGLNTYIDPDDPNHFRENMLTIYDRWGRKVYEVKNYDTYLNNKGEVVVGNQAFGGEKCPDGTYYFTFYYKGKVKTFHLNGTLMIVRETK